MTIASTVTSVQYTGNNATTQYAFNNKIFAASDLVVTLIDTLGNQYPFTNQVNSTLGLSYTVANVDVDTGCSITFSAAPQTGWTIDIRTDTPELQTTSIKNQGSFLPELHEEFFDKIVRITQDDFRQAYTFGIHGPDIEAIPWPTLPIASARKGLALLFDSVTGLPTVGTPASATFTGQQLAIYGTDSGAVNAYVFTHAGPVPPTLTVGTLIRFFPLNTNTGPSTINADSTGATAIVNQNGAALTGGELSSLGPVVLQNTGTAWQIVSTAGAQLGFQRTAAEIAAGVTPTNYAYQPGDVRRYGAKGDGTTDDSNALETAANSGEKFIVYKSGLNFKITRALNFQTSGVTHLMRGATITQATTNTVAINLGYNGTSFVKTDNTTFEGGKIVGADNGLTSTVSWGIQVFAPSNNPYVAGTGCSHLKVIDTWIDSFTGCVAATAADDILIDGMLATNMQYHASVGAGGYGVLVQTCFGVKVSERCRFVGGTNSRHAIYISADPNRTFDANNVCYDVNIGACMIDWSLVSGVTGFEWAIQARGTFDLCIVGTSIKGSFGGILYQLENAPGSNITISNINATNIRAVSNSVAAVAFSRNSNAYRASNVAVTNVTATLANNANLIGVQLAYIDGLVSGGHSITCPSGNYLYGIYTVDCTDQVHMPSRISGTKNTGMYWFQVSVPNSNVQVDRQQISGAGTSFGYGTVPTNLRFTYPRSFSVSWAAGVPTIVNDDYSVAASAASDPNGFTVTLNNEITAGNLNFSLMSQASSVGTVYFRSVAGQVITIGVQDHTGAALPGASNNYTVTIVALH